MATALDIRDLSVRFDTQHGNVQAVDSVSFQIEEGETLGLVGESGSGKSVTSLAIMGLVPTPPGVVTADAILLGDRDLNRLNPEALRRVRGKEVAMVFQDPMTSLNPLLTVGRQLTEVLEVHEGLSRAEAFQRAIHGLGDVGIPAPEERLAAYPHELSGGMRQRVMIAMALLCKPKVLLADEPTTALDVTIQAQILELMKDLQERHGTAILLVTHDLGVVAGMSDRVNVMYAGRIVETAATTPLFDQPCHPYTQGLLSSVPDLSSEVGQALHSIPGQPPDLAELPSGCAFHPRCPHARDECKAAIPPTLEPRPNHHSACLDAELLAQGAETTQGGSPQ